MTKPTGIRTWRLFVAFFIGFGGAGMTCDSLVASSARFGGPPKPVIVLVSIGWFVVVVWAVYGPVVRYYWLRRK